MENFNCLINIYNYYYVTAPAEARVEEVPEAAPEPEPEAAPEVAPKEEDDDNSDNSSSSSSNDEWDMEREELVCEAEQARERMYELSNYALEKSKIFHDAKEELEKAAREMEEAEEEFKHKSEYVMKRCEEIKQEKLAKKKRKLN